MRWNRRCISAAAGSVVAAVLPAHGALAASPPNGPILTNYSILNNVHLTSYVASPVQSPPVNGFVPQVVFGLTNEENPDNPLFAAEEGQVLAGLEPPGAGNHWLANNVATARYLVATLDSGAQAHIITLADEPDYDFAGNDLESGNEAVLIGAGGTTIANITNPLGIYMTGFANAGSGANATVSGTLKGQFNAAILTATEPTSIPFNVIGSPILAQYQVSILNSDPRTLTVNGKTYHSPNVTLTTLSTDPPPPLPSSYYRLTLDVSSPAGVSPVASYIPTLDSGSLEFEPATPSFWMDGHVRQRQRRRRR